MSLHRTGVSVLLEDVVVVAVLRVELPLELLLDVVVLLAVVLLAVIVVEEIVVVLDAEVLLLLTVELEVGNAVVDVTAMVVKLHELHRTGHNSRTAYFIKT